MMLVLSQIPRQRAEGIGMSQELADIHWGHAHLAHPGRRCCTCPMGGNTPNDIRLADTRNLAEQRDRMFVEEVSSHQLTAILEEILCGLVRFAIWQWLLIGWTLTLPYLNGIGHVRR